MLRQELKQKLLQKLSPQQIQVIKLLEIPTFQLEQKIKKELEENPLLDEGEGYEVAEDQHIKTEEEQADEETTPREDQEVSIDAMDADNDIPYYKLSTMNYSPDDKKVEIPFSVGISFHEHLENQLNMRMLDERQHDIARYLIGNIEDDGYIRRDILSITDDLAFNENMDVSPKEVEDIIKIIQDFEPAGVGARDLRECLLIQLRNKENMSPELEIAERILVDHFEEFTKKHYDKIISQTGLSEKQLEKGINEILKLQPKPGSTYSDEYNKVLEHIIPDYILENRDGQLVLSLNSKNVPDLRMNKTYVDMIDQGNRKKQNKEAQQFLKQKFNSARWFIEAIKQRQNTLMATMQAILDYQYDYFVDGDERKLRPMILKDIADITHFDVSTISRVVSSKYIQTHFGIFPLKFFFSEAMQTQSGEEVSSREIKKILQDCIDKENKKKPLTDDRLSIILNEKGYNIARRTVAKYREQLDIPVARLRKELKS